MQKVHGTATLGAYEAASPRRLIPGSVGGVPSSMFTISKPPHCPSVDPFFFPPSSWYRKCSAKPGFKSHLPRLGQYGWPGWYARQLRGCRRPWPEGGESSGWSHVPLGRSPSQSRSSEINCRNFYEFSPDVAHLDGWTIPGVRCGNGSYFRKVLGRLLRRMYEISSRFETRTRNDCSCTMEVGTIKLAKEDGNHVERKQNQGPPRPPHGSESRLAFIAWVVRYIYLS